MLKKIFKLLKRKTQLEKLQLKQEELLKKAYKQSKINRKKSDAYVREANEVTQKIDTIMKQYENYLMGKKLPNSFNKTIEHFKNYKDCVLIFIRDTNLKSVSQTLRDYKDNKFYKKGNDKLIRNYGIGAQIIKSLNIKNMILVTRSKKKVVGLEGYGIKITKQEIIK